MDENYARVAQFGDISVTVDRFGVARIAAKGISCIAYNSEVMLDTLLRWETVENEGGCGPTYSVARLEDTPEGPHLVLTRPSPATWGDTPYHQAPVTVAALQEVLDPDLHLYRPF